MTFNDSIAGRILSTTLLFACALTLTAGCSGHQSAGRQLDDATITSKIKSKLTADPEINPLYIDIDTVDGYVTLRGKVEKADSRTGAERLARETDGVVGVDNRLKLVAEGAADDVLIEDGWITAKIKSKIAADPELNPFNIDIDTEDGVVTLTGSVASADRRAEAERLARATKGVVDVLNELVVRKR